MIKSKSFSQLDLWIHPPKVTTEIIIFPKINLLWIHPLISFLDKQYNVLCNTLHFFCIYFLGNLFVSISSVLEFHLCLTNKPSYFYYTYIYIFCSLVQISTYITVFLGSIFPLFQKLLIYIYIYMQLYVYIYIYISIHIYIYVYIYAVICIHIYVQLYVYIYIYRPIHIYIYEHELNVSHIYMCVYIYVHIHLYIYVHIHTCMCIHVYI